MSKKQIARIISAAEQRADALRPLEPKLVLSPNLSLTAFGASITELRGKLADYSRMETDLESLRADLDARCRAIADISSRLLKSVHAQFGSNSEEYARAGGIRASDRRRPARREGAQERPVPPQA